GPNGTGSQTIWGLRGDDEAAGRTTVAVVTTSARGRGRAGVDLGVGAWADLGAGVRAGAGVDASDAVGAWSWCDPPAEPHAASSTTITGATSARKALEPPRLVSIAAE